MIDLIAYILTEEVPLGLDGPSANLALGDLLSNVMHDGKKDKIGPDGMVTCLYSHERWFFNSEFLFSANAKR